MLRVEGVTKSFGDLCVLKNLSFSIEEGEIVGLIGPSGAGKSVLLKIIGDVIDPDSGRVTRPAPSANVGDSGVGFLFQEGALFDSMSVIENVAFPLRSNQNLSYQDMMVRAHDILCKVGLSDAYKKLPGQLSGGMRRRVGIARALVSNPSLVLLDDPTGGLDPVAARVIMNLILSLHETYQPTVVLVSHDIRRLLPSVARIIGLFDGRIACDEPVEALSSRVDPKVTKFLATRYDFESASRTSE